MFFGPFRYNMCEFASKILLKIETVRGFIKIVSIPDEEWFFEMAVGCTTTYFIIILNVPVGFITPFPSFRQCVALFAVAEG